LGVGGSCGAAKGEQEKESGGREEGPGVHRKAPGRGAAGRDIVAAGKGFLRCMRARGGALCDWRGNGGG
jgi:hypothetical protein